MNKTEMLFYKTVTEVIPTLIDVDVFEYEKEKIRCIQEIQEASASVKNFFQVLFEIVDEKRNK